MDDPTYDVIQSELNDLFKKENFDERDLLALDQKIRDVIKDNEDKKAKAQQEPETDAMTEVNLLALPQTDPGDGVYAATKAPTKTIFAKTINTQTNTKASQLFSKRGSLPDKQNSFYFKRRI